jgi:CDGSH-type Zn-finger protein
MTTVTIIENGPAIINAPEGLIINGEEKEKVAICRCGKTGNGPFCDGSHKKQIIKEDVEENSPTILDGV